MYRVITGCLKENIRSESVMQKKGNSFSAFHSVEIYLDACNIYTLFIWLKTSVMGFPHEYVAYEVATEARTHERKLIHGR